MRDRLYSAFQCSDYNQAGWRTYMWYSYRLVVLVNYTCSLLPSYVLHLQSCFVKTKLFVSLPLQADSCLPGYHSLIVVSRCVDEISCRFPWFWPLRTESLSMLCVCNTQTLMCTSFGRVTMRTRSLPTPLQRKHAVLKISSIARSVTTSFLLWYLAFMSNTAPVHSTSCLMQQRLSGRRKLWWGQYLASNWSDR